MARSATDPQCQPNVISYSALMTVYCQVRLAAFTMHAAMLRTTHLHASTHAALSAAVHHACTMHQTALQPCLPAAAQPHRQRDAHLKNRGCMQAGQLDKAEDAFQHMKLQGVTPDHICYSTLIAGRPSLSIIRALTRAAACLPGLVSGSCTPVMVGQACQAVHTGLRPTGLQPSQLWSSTTSWSVQGGTTARWCRPGWCPAQLPWR